MSIELYSPTYFGICMIGGVLSCGLTHAAVTPLDLVKCNAQTSPKDFPGTIAGFRNIYNGKVTHLGFDSGLRGVARGWGPTLVGYSIQGLFKFGLYEIFKYQLSSSMTEENALKYRSLIHCLGSGGAEFFADLAYCPFEAVKVRVQTSPEFARGMLDGMPKMLKQEGFGTFYAGLAPLWARQIPYTIIKFVAFEKIAEKFYSMCSKPKDEMSKTEQLGVVFASGYTAGLICGAVSHPADTMVSKINKVQSAGGVMSKMKIIYSGTAETPGIGFRGLWAGFWPRVVMIGTLTGLQWFIYGSFKSATGLPTPGAQIKKE